MARRVRGTDWNEQIEDGNYSFRDVNLIINIIPLFEISISAEIPVFIILL